MENIEKLIELINTDYKEIVNYTLKKKLGVDVDMEARITGYRKDCIEMVDTLDNVNVTNKLINNKLLKHLFKSCYLYINVWVFDNEFGFRVNIGYTHPDGGGNGHELLLFYVDRESLIVKYPNWQKY